MKMTSLSLKTFVRRAEKKQKETRKNQKLIKKLIENIDLFEQEHITKKVILNFRNHLDDSRSKSQIFQK